MLHSSNFVTLFHRQNFALYGISYSNTVCLYHLSLSNVILKYVRYGRELIWGTSESQEIYAVAAVLYVAGQLNGNLI